MIRITKFYTANGNEFSLSVESENVAQALETLDKAAQDAGAKAPAKRGRPAKDKHAIPAGEAGNGAVRESTRVELEGGLPASRPYLPGPYVKLTDDPPVENKPQSVAFVNPSISQQILEVVEESIKCEPEWKEVIEKNLYHLNKSAVNLHGEDTEQSLQFVLDGVKKYRERMRDILRR